MKCMFRNVYITVLNYIVKFVANISWTFVHRFIRCEEVLKDFTFSKSAKRNICYVSLKYFFCQIDLGEHMLGTSGDQT